MTNTNINEDQVPTWLDLDSTQFRAWQKEGHFEQIKERFASHFKWTKSIV